MHSPRRGRWSCSAPRARRSRFRSEATTISREIRTSSAPETEAAGEHLARFLRAGDLILLEGELGAGKTTFVRGLARGLGCTGQVQSPTFQLVRIYPGPLPLAHVDLFRLSEGDQLDDLDLEDRLEEGVVAVEWGQRLPGGCTARVTFQALGPNSRQLTLVEAPSAWSW